MNVPVSLPFRHPAPVEGSAPSFPSCTWERLLFPAKFHFALTYNRRREALDHALTGAVTRSAMELPQQLRSQMEFGNEGTRPARPGGFTLLEMMITLAVFILLAAAVFGLMTAVLESTSTLQDNQNRRDEVAALNAFFKKKLGELPAGSSLVTYQRGTGEGLVQNGIIFGTHDLATAIDGKVQANGYYALRLATFIAGTVQGQPQDARAILQQAVISNDPTLTWIQLMGDIKTLDWKFLDLNATVWVELWSGPNNPNMVEFSMQPAGELQPTTMDFWLPKLEAAVMTVPPQPTTP